MKRYNGLIDNFKDRASRIVPNRRQLEEAISGKIKKYEPGLTQFYSDVRSRAEKMGVPVENLETRVLSSYKQTVLKLEKIGEILPFFKKNSGRQGPVTAAVRKKASKRTTKARTTTRAKSGSRKKNPKATTA